MLLHWKGNRWHGKNTDSLGLVGIEKWGYIGRPLKTIESSHASKSIFCRLCFFSKPASHYLLSSKAVLYNPRIKDSPNWFVGQSRRKHDSGNEISSLPRGVRVFSRQYPLAPACPRIPVVSASFKLFPRGSELGHMLLHFQDYTFFTTYMYNLPRYV
jgi:hypothetical protein